jgi:hypothetical protein
VLLNTGGALKGTALDRASRHESTGSEGGKIVLKLSIALSGAVLALSLAASAAVAQPIASADGEQAGTRIDITELKRTSGDTLTLKFTIVNESGEDTDMPFSNQVASEIYLVDAAGKKKYLTISDAEGQCVCSQRVGSSLASGEAKNLWAKFPAPPADVQEVSVVFPRFVPADAPISE